MLAHEELGTPTRQRIRPRWLDWTDPTIGRVRCHSGLRLMNEIAARMTRIAVFDRIACEVRNAASAWIENDCNPRNAAARISRSSSSHFHQQIAKL